MSSLLAADSRIPALGVAREMGLEGDEIAPIQPTMNVRAAIRSLAEAGLVPEALALLARGLALPALVQWGFDCVEQAEEPAKDQASRACLQAVRAWLARPDEDPRRAASDCVPKDGLKTPAHWLAQGVAWTGGSLTPEGVDPISPAAHLPAKAVATAVVLAAIGEDRDRKLTDFLRAGAKLSG